MCGLDGSAACLFGGAGVTGGSGTVVGAVVGGLIMAVMSNGMQLLGVDQTVQPVVKGMVLLIAVAFDVYDKRPAVSAQFDPAVRHRNRPPPLPPSHGP